MDVARLPARMRGFTLIEMMTALAVLMVLLAVGVPQWRELAGRNAQSAARAQMRTALQLARQSAVQYRQSATLCATLDNATCSDDYSAWHLGYMLFLDDDADRQRDAGERILHTVDATPTDVIIHTSSGRPTIRFDSDGSAWGSNVTVRFCSGDNTTHNRAIILYGSGRVRLSPTLSDGDPVTCDG